MKKHSLLQPGGIFFVLILLFFLIVDPVRSAQSNKWVDSKYIPQSPTFDLAANLHFLPLVTNETPKPVGSLIDAWYLLVDDGHIVFRDVNRVYHPFQRYAGNPIMKATLPWEGKIIQLYGTVLPGFRMWYSTYNKDWDLTQVLYAESQNGLTWDKPFFEDSGTNALFGGDDANIVSVMHTPQFSQSPYKIMILQNDGFHGFSSLNGIDTDPYPENPLFDNGEDVAHFYWDPNVQRYAGTAKEIHDIRGVLRRTMRLISSYNYTDWNEQPELLAPDLIDDQAQPGIYPHFYGLPIFPIGEQYLGLLWILNAVDTTGLYGKVNIQLVSSHDSNTWIREEGVRPPILDVGPPGAWDDSQVYSATAPIRNGDELWLYYSGCNLIHGASLSDMVCSIGLATAKYNRLASLQGSGVVLTGELTPKGPYLHLNYNATQGELRVELLKDGQILPGYERYNCNPLTGDSLDQMVTWTGQTSLPVGPFQIKFYLQNSSIYAFAIAEP